MLSSDIENSGARSQPPSLTRNQRANYGGQRNPEDKKEPFLAEQRGVEVMPDLIRHPVDISGFRRSPE